MSRITPIDDLDDPRLAVYRHLKTHNATRALDQFVVEGAKLVERLLASPFPLVSVLASDRQADTLAGRLPPAVPLYVLPESRLHAVVGYNFHGGMLGCGARRAWPSLRALTEQAGPHATVVVCPRLDNPDNLGAVVRLADVFGITAVVVGPRCPDPLSRRVLRVSMGSALRVPVLMPPDLAAAWETLRTDLGYGVVGAVVDPSAEPLPAFQRPDRLAVVLGSEAHGLEPPWLARCDRRLTIPMRPGAESLNVAVAAGIILHQLTTGRPSVPPLHDFPPAT